MKRAIIADFEAKHLTKAPKLPDFRVGDTVSVHYRIKDREDPAKSRIQQFEGVVTRIKRGTANASFTVRKVGAGGIGVERVFPNISPNVAKVDLKSKGVVRRSKLYFLRDLSGKSARIKSKFMALDQVGGTEADGFGPEATPPVEG